MRNMPKTPTVEMSQQDRLLELLREGPVTPLQAWVQIGCYRVSDCVLKLRRRGHVIETKMKPFTTARGYKVKFAEYWLHPPHD